MTFSEAISYLDHLRPVGMQMGLERTKVALAALGNPECAYPTVHIAGTNGKGSTAQMIAAMLTANGYRTGLYTSPPISSVCETIAIDGEIISEEAFAASISRVAQVMPQGLSEYECLTTAMFTYFQTQNVDIAVIECCLGGETDTTNVIPAPQCAVFTPISIDHTAILGDTIEKIAKQKSGIIKAACDVVCAPSMHEEALGTIFEKAADVGSTVHSPSMKSTAITSRGGTTIIVNDHEITLSLIGKHQEENAVTALTVMKRLENRGFRFNEEASYEALSHVHMPCRLEIINNDPLLLLDGAHNPHGISALCDTIRQLTDQPITLMIGMLADKNTDTCLSLLAPLCRQIICCTAPHDTRALDAEKLAENAKRYHHNVVAIDDPLTAWQYAQKNAQTTPIVVGGSFYTAGAVRKHLLK